MKKLIYHSNFVKDAENRGTEFQVYFDDSKPGGCFVRAKIDGKWKQGYTVTKMFIREYLEQESYRNQQNIIDSFTAKSPAMKILQDALKAGMGDDWEKKGVPLLS